MLLIQISKSLAATAAAVLANLVIFMCFAIAVFGRLDLFYGGIGLLNLLVCGLTFRTVFRPRTNHLWTGLEFIGLGLVTISARFVITDIAYYASGAMVFAGLLALAGAKFAPKQKPRPTLR